MAGKVLNITVLSPFKLRSGLTGKYHAICHYSYNFPLGHMLKKTPDTLTMTSTYRHIISQTDFTTGLTRLDQQCNRTRTKTVDKNGKRKSPRFAFLKISASAQ